MWCIVNKYIAYETIILCYGNRSGTRMNGGTNSNQAKYKITYEIWMPTTK